MVCCILKKIATPNDTILRGHIFSLWHVSNENWDISDGEVMLG
jgi:hypothetical protein